MSEIAKTMLTIYSLVITILLMIRCLINIEYKNKEEIKWGLELISLVPILILLMNVR